MYITKHSEPALEWPYSNIYYFLKFIYQFLPWADGQIFSFMFCHLGPTMEEWVIIMGLDKKK